MLLLYLSYSLNYIVWDPYAFNKTLIKYPVLRLVFRIRKLHSLRQQAGSKQTNPEKAGWTDRGAALTSFSVTTLMLGRGHRAVDEREMRVSYWPTVCHVSFIVHPNLMRRVFSLLRKQRLWRVCIACARSHTAPVWGGEGGPGFRCKSLSYIFPLCLPW